MSGWLRDELGVRVPLTTVGTIIGRSSTCGIVVDEPDVSRAHVLVVDGAGAAHVVPLGRRAALLRGASIVAPTWARDGDELRVGTARFVFEIRGAEPEERPEAPPVELERGAGGATLRVGRDAGRAAWLPHKRADLVASLLQPPSGDPMGAWVGDEVLASSIWGPTGASRTQLNTLIHRARESLSEAGLDGAALIERAPGGGATRFVVPSAGAGARRPTSPR